MPTTGARKEMEVISLSDWIASRIRQGIYAERFDIDKNLVNQKHEIVEHGKVRLSPAMASLIFDTSGDEAKWIASKIPLKIVSLS